MIKNIDEAIICECKSLLCTVRVSTTEDPLNAEEAEELSIDFIIRRGTFWRRVRDLFKPTYDEAGVLTTRTRFKEIAAKL